MSKSSLSKAQAWILSIFLDAYGWASRLRHRVQLPSDRWYAERLAYAFAGPHNAALALALQIEANHIDGWLTRDLRSKVRALALLKTMPEDSKYQSREDPFWVAQSHSNTSFRPAIAGRRFV